MYKTDVIYDEDGKPVEMDRKKRAAVVTYLGLWDKYYYCFYRHDNGEMEHHKMEFVFKSAEKLKIRSRWEAEPEIIFTSDMVEFYNACREKETAKSKAYMEELEKHYANINDIEKRFLELALDFSKIYREHANVIVKNAEVIADYIWSFEDSFFSMRHDERENIHTAFLDEMSKDMLFTPRLDWMEDCA